MVEMRKAALEDINEIMEIIDGGRITLKAQGLPQWQDGYAPSREQITLDIQQGATYVLSSYNEIIATAALIQGVDPVYTAIKGGTWEGSGPYLSIHRFAVKPTNTKKRVGATFLGMLENEGKKLEFKDLRIDTHDQNIGMRKVIERNGFLEKGTVIFPIPNGERVAYQKILA